MTLPIDAMVLVGGLGTRLRAVVADRPKPLAEVAGRPFLDRILDQLLAAGIRRAILCTGYRGEQIEAEYGDRYDELELVYAPEPEPIGTGGALRAAASLVRGDRVLLLNGDSYCAVDLAAFVAFAQARGAQAALVAAKVDDRGRFGALDLDDRGLVKSFAEKGALPGQGFINAGIYCFTREWVLALTPHAPLSLERDVLPTFLGAPTPLALHAYATDAAFLDIGTPDDYARAEAFFAIAAQTIRAPHAGLLVLDRDGTLIADKPYLADPREVELLPGVVEGLRRFAQRGYQLAVVTNQSGVGRGKLDEATLSRVHDELRRQLAAQGIELHGIWHCPHHPEAGCSCRKPEPALLEDALARLGFTPEQCLLVGDQRCDVELGRRLGVRTALVRTGQGAQTERAGACVPDLVVDDLEDLASRALAQHCPAESPQ